MFKYNFKAKSSKRYKARHKTRHNCAKIALQMSKISIFSFQIEIEFFGKFNRV